MKLSVALYAHNENYLFEQLESIAEQSRLPDEMIIIDDFSDDSTAQILKNFKTKVPFEVSIHRTSQFIGLAEGIYMALDLCTTDLIVICEQDNVWKSHRLAVIEKIFIENPEAGIIFTNAEVVNRELMPMGYDLWSYMNFGRQEQRIVRRNKAFSLLLTSEFVNGAVLTINSKFKNLAGSLPENIYRSYGGWLCLVISAVAPMIFLDEKLLLYREYPVLQQFEANIVAPDDVSENWMPSWRVNIYHEQANILELVSERLEKSGIYDQNLLHRLNVWKNYLNTRGDLPKSKFKRIPAILKQLFLNHYTLYSSGVFSAVRDLLRHI